jgi:hypothetical protein
VATDTPAKPTPTAQPADAKPEAAAPAKPKRPAARKRAASAKRAATTNRATDAATTRVAPRPDRNRAAVLSVLDAQERTANAFAEYQTRAAELSRIPGATTLANAQADLLRRVTVTFVTAARDLLK